MSLRTNHQARQTDEPEDPSRPDDLRKPVQGNYGACGCIDDRVKNGSVPVCAVQHIGWYRRAAAVVFLTIAAAIDGALATLCQVRRRGEWGELGKAGGCRRHR